MPQTVDLGYVQGPAGPTGPQGPKGTYDEIIGQPFNRDSFTVESSLYVNGTKQTYTFKFNNMKSIRSLVVNNFFVGGFKGDTFLPCVTIQDYEFVSGDIISAKIDINSYLGTPEYKVFLNGCVQTLDNLLVGTYAIHSAISDNSIYFQMTAICVANMNVDRPINLV